MSSISGAEFNQTGPDYASGIPLNLLKNFNAYDVLQPKQIENNPTQSDSQDLLIDFDSHMERTVKNEEEGFTLIDLYQNIYVTPQHVSKPTNTIETDIDYDEFFRKIESNKLKNQNQAPHSGPIDLDLSYFEELESIKSSKSSRSSFSVCQSDDSGYKGMAMGSSEDKSPYNDCNNVQEISPVNHESYQEDLVEEVLLNRTLDKLKVSDMSREFFEDVKFLSAPNISNKSIKSEESVNKKSINLVQPQNSTKIHNFLVYYPKADKLYDQKTSGIGKINKANFFNNSTDMSMVPNRIIHQPNLVHNDELVAEKSFVKSWFTTDPNQDNKTSAGNVNESYKMNQSYGINVNQFNISQLKVKNDHLTKLKCSVIDELSKSFVTDLTILTKITVNPESMKSMSVQATKKDNKEYARNRITRREIEKLTFTRGPDLNEKRVMLPRLLERLAEQKKDFEANSQVVKRSLLYPDKIEVKKNINSASTVLNPTILMEDCNKERLKALKIRQSLANFIESGNILH